MEFRNVKFEEASPLQRRALEGVLRILGGHNTSFVGTVATNMMIEVITAEVPDDNLNHRFLYRFPGGRAQTGDA